MSAPLTLFPARVAIGTANGVPVYMSAEFTRALSLLLERVGGPIGPGTDDLALEDAMSGAIPLLAALAATVAEVQHQLAQAATERAAVAELRKLLEHQAMDQAAPVLILPGDPLFDAPLPTDWEHPGRIGAATPNSGKFTTLAASGQITSTLAPGTAPLVVASTTKVANLNADLLDGTDWAAPGTIGGTTPGSANFTTVAAAGVVSTRAYTNVSDTQLVAAGNIPGLNLRATGAGRLSLVTNYQAANTSSIQVGTADANPTAEAMRIDHATLAIWNKGDTTVAGKFGCNGKAPQPAAALPAAATDATTTQALANSIRAALIAAGIGA